MSGFRYDYDFNDMAAIFTSSLEVGGEYQRFLPNFCKLINSSDFIQNEERDRFLFLKHILPNAIDQFLSFGKINNYKELSMLKSFIHKIIKFIPTLCLGQCYNLESVIPKIFNSKSKLYENNNNSYSISTPDIQLYKGMIRTLKKVEMKIFSNISDYQSETNLKLIICIYSNISKSNLSNFISGEVKQQCIRSMTDFLQSQIHNMNIQIPNNVPTLNLTDFASTFDTFCDFLSPFDKENTVFLYQILENSLNSTDINFQKFGAHCISKLCDDSRQANYILNSLASKSFNHFLMDKKLSSSSISELEPFLQLLIRQDGNQLNALFDILNSMIQNSEIEENEVYCNFLATSLRFFNHDLISVFVSTISTFLYPFFFKFAEKAILVLQQKDPTVSSQLVKTLLHLAFVDDNASSALFGLFDKTKNNSTSVSVPIAQIVLDSIVPLLRNGEHFDFAHKLILKMIDSLNEPNSVFRYNKINNIIAIANDENRSLLLDLLFEIFLKTKAKPEQQLFSMVLSDPDDKSWNFLKLMISNHIIQYRLELDDIYKYAIKQDAISVSRTFVRFLKVLIFYKNKSAFVAQNQIDTVENINCPFKITEPLYNICGLDFIFKIYQLNNNILVEKSSKNFLIKVLRNVKFTYAVKFLINQFDHFKEINEDVHPIVFKSLNMVKLYLQIAEANCDPEDFCFSRHSYPDNMLCLKVKEAIEFNVHIDPTKTLKDLKMRIAQRKRLKYENIIIENFENAHENETLFGCGFINGTEIIFSTKNSFFCSTDTITEPPSLIFHRDKFENVLLHYLDNINSEQVDSLIMEILNLLPDSADEKHLLNEKKEFIERLKNLKNFNKKKYFLSIIVKYDNDDHILKYPEGRDLIYSLFQHEELRDEAIKVMNKYYLSDELNDLSLLIASDLLKYICKCQKDEITKEIFELLHKFAEKNESLAGLCDSNSEEITSAIQGIKVADWDQMISFLSILNRDVYFLDLIESEMKGNIRNSGFYLRLLPRMIINRSVSDEKIRDIYSYLVEKLAINDESLPEITKTVGRLLEVMPELVKTVSTPIPINTLLSLSFGERYASIQTDALDLFSMLIKINESCSERIVEYLFSIVDHPIDKWNYNPSMYIRSAPFSGLRNLGATCFLNSVFQQLFHIFPIRYKLAKYKFEPGSEIATLQNLFLQMNYTKKPYCDTSNFMDSWTGWNRQKLSRKEQQDAVEFFLALLDTLPSEITQLFKGQITNYLEGEEIEHHGSLKESFLNLSISIKGCNNIESSLKEIIQIEWLDDYQCEELKQKIRVRKYSKITHTPPILAIQLKRFEYDFKTRERYKINDKFEFPLQIDIQSLCSPDEQSSDQSGAQINNCQAKIYELSGMIIHSGIASIGHYKSIIRKGDNWWSFNDAEVSKMSQKEVLSDAFGEKEGTSAYILFYVQKDYCEDDKTNIFKEEFDFSNELNHSDLETVLVENDIFIKTQAIFNSLVVDFVQKLPSSVLNLAFYINILCHSKHASKANSFSSAVILSIEKSSSYAESVRYLQENVLNIINNYVNCSQEQLTNGLNKIIQNIISKVEPKTMFDFLNEYIEQIPKIDNLPFKQIPIILKVAENFIAQFTDMAVKNGWMQKLLNILNYIYDEHRYYPHVYTNIDLSLLFKMLYNVLNESESTDMTPLLKYSNDIQKSSVSSHSSAFHDVLFAGIFKHDLDTKVVKEIITRKDYNYFNEKVFPYFVKEFIDCTDIQSMGGFVNSILKTGLMSELDIYSKITNEVRKSNKPFVLKLIEISPRILQDALLNENNSIRCKAEDIYSHIIKGSSMSSYAGHQSEFVSNIPQLLNGFLTFFDDFLSTENNLQSYYPQKTASYSYMTSSEYRLLSIIKIIGMLIDKSINVEEEIVDKLISFIEKLSTKVNSDNITTDFHIKELTNIISKLKIDKFKEKKYKLFMMMFDRLEKAKDENVGSEIKPLISMFFEENSDNSKLNETSIELLKTEKFQRFLVRLTLISQNGNVNSDAKVLLDAILKYANSADSDKQIFEICQNLLCEIAEIIFRNEKISNLIKRDIINRIKSNPRLINADTLSNIINGVLKKIQPISGSIFEVTSMLESIASININFDLKSIEFDAEYVKNRWRIISFDKKFFLFVLWLYRHSSEICEKKDEITNDLIADASKAISPVLNCRAAFIEYVVNFCFEYQNVDVLIEIYEKLQNQDIILRHVNDSFKYSSFAKKYSSYDWTIPFFLNFKDRLNNNERVFANTLSTSLSDDSILKIITKFEKDYVDAYEKNSSFKRDVTSRFALFMNLFSEKQNAMKMYSEVKIITPEMLIDIKSSNFLDQHALKILTKS